MITSLPFSPAPHVAGEKVSLHLFLSPAYLVALHGSKFYALAFFRSLAVGRLRGESIRSASGLDS